MNRNAVGMEAPVCTCGEAFQGHTAGRCADVILHKLFYGLESELSPPGTEIIDGPRMIPLFEEDYTFVDVDGERKIVPDYTSKPELALRLFQRWYDLGGTGELRMNRSGWSARWQHDVVRTYSYYRDNHIKRARLEWLPIRSLAYRVVNYYRAVGLDDCTWIDGVPELEEEDE